MLPVIECRIYREKIGKVIVETYIARYHTAREGGLEPGYHVIMFHPRANSPYRDGISVNGTWFEDLDDGGDDYFSINLWSELTGMTLDEFENRARIFESTFNPDIPDQNQIIL